MTEPNSRRHPDERRLSTLGAVAFSVLILVLGAGVSIADPDPPNDPQASAGPLLLLSQSEIDALPLDTPVAWATKPTSDDGPRIEIDSPTHNGTYEGPFPIRVEFLPGPKGHEVDLDSLKLEYKKAWGIDITSRVRDYIEGTVIDVAESELPTGRHTVEVEIADVARNLSRRIFTVTIK